MWTHVSTVTLVVGHDSPPAPSPTIQAMWLRHRYPPPQKLAEGYERKWHSIPDLINLNCFLQINHSFHQRFIMEPLWETGSGALEQTAISRTSEPLSGERETGTCVSALISTSRSKMCDLGTQGVGLSPRPRWLSSVSRLEYSLCLMGTIRKQRRDRVYWRCSRIRGSSGQVKQSEPRRERKETSAVVALRPEYLVCSGRDCREAVTFYLSFLLWPPGVVTDFLE